MIAPRLLSNDLRYTLPTLLSHTNYIDRGASLFRRRRLTRQDPFSPCIAWVPIGLVFTVLHCLTFGRKGTLVSAVSVSASVIIIAGLVEICCSSRTASTRGASNWANVAPAFEGVQAEPLAAYTSFEALEGDGDFRGVILFEFSSMEEARRWYKSAAYQEVKRLREGAADFDHIPVDGGVVSAAAERMPQSKP
jgi:uncharacterized protein (DUF1330 family)